MGDYRNCLFALHIFAKKLMANFFRLMVMLAKPIKKEVNLNFRITLVSHYLLRYNLRRTRDYVYLIWRINILCLSAIQTSQQLVGTHVLWEIVIPGNSTIARLRVYNISFSEKMAVLGRFVRR